MAETFRDALLWHMDAERTTIAALAHGAGVSADIIKKLRSRAKASTSAEVAERIASFYGKTLDQFLRREPPGQSELAALLNLLTDDEKAFVLRQVRGMLATRGDQ